MHHTLSLFPHFYHLSMIHLALNLYITLLRQCSLLLNYLLLRQRPYMGRVLYLRWRRRLQICSLLSSDTLNHFSMLSFGFLDAFLSHSNFDLMGVSSLSSLSTYRTKQLDVDCFEGIFITEVTLLFLCDFDSFFGAAIRIHLVVDKLPLSLRRSHLSLF
jgi:hypothetical protein